MSRRRTRRTPPPIRFLLVLVAVEEVGEERPDLLATTIKPHLPDLAAGHCVIQTGKMSLRDESMAFEELSDSFDAERTQTAMILMETALTPKEMQTRIYAALRDQVSGRIAISCDCPPQAAAHHFLGVDPGCRPLKST